jgi:hypothetical protein
MVVSVEPALDPGERLVVGSQRAQVQLVEYVARYRVLFVQLVNLRKNPRGE